jgi:hypothetical protein
METAALMELPQAKWFVEVQLRERDWGTFDIMSQKERVVRFSEETRRRDRDSLFYAPPGGESLVHVLSRVDGVLTNFNRQCSNRRCIVVCHGEVMWAFRLRFERLSQLTYREMEAASSPFERIHNCQILWYSRRNPNTGEISRFFKWKRSICPWDLSRSNNQWEEIVRTEHTNDSLLAHVNRVKRIYAHEKSHRATKLASEEEPAFDKEATIGAHAAVLASTVAPPMNPKKILGVENTPVSMAPRSSAGSMKAPPGIAEELNELKKGSGALADELQILKRDMPVAAAAAANPPPHRGDEHLPESASESAAAAATVGDSIEFNDSHPAEGSPGSQLIAAAVAESTSEDDHLPLSGGPREPISAISIASPPHPHFGAQGGGGSGQQAPAWTPAPGWPFLSAHPRVLVLTKTPRWEHEKNTSGLRGSDLHAELSKLGFVSDRLVQSYVRHMEGLSQLTSSLQQQGMKVVVKHVDSATRADLEGVDLILSAGGDGTMLKAAALLGYHDRETVPRAAAAAGAAGATNAGAEKSSITVHHPASSEESIESPPAESSDSHVAATSTAAISAAATAAARPRDPNAPPPYIPIPLIGVNTDPLHSSGVLCAFSIEGPHTAERVIEHLRKGHFVWLNKSRIEITLIDKTGAVRTIEHTTREM